MGPSPGIMATKRALAIRYDTAATCMCTANTPSRLTIAAENDIVINGNLTTPVNGEGTPDDHALLGLIANKLRAHLPSGASKRTKAQAQELETTRESQLESAAGTKRNHLGRDRSSGFENGSQGPRGSEYEIVVTKFEV